MGEGGGGGGGGVVGEKWKGRGLLKNDNELQLLSDVTSLCISICIVVSCY